MKKIILIIALVLISFPAFATKDKESAYDRVMRTGELRCGYSLWPTYLEIDPNSGAFSGICYEYMQEVGNLIDVEIKWTAEVPYGDINTAIKSGRIDAFCSGLWQDVKRTKEIDYTIPITFQAVVPVVRKDDDRFDNDLSLINDESVKVAAVDLSLIHI